MRPKIIKVSSFEDGSYTIKAPPASTERPFGPDAPRAPEPRIAAAQDKAGQIIALAEDDADLIRRRAREEGHREGFQSGLAEAQSAVLEEHGRLLESMGHTIQNFQNDFTKREEVLTMELSKLAIAICAKLLAIELSHSRDAAIPMAQAAVKLLTDKARVRLRVHPLDLENVIAMKNQIMLSVDGLSQLEVVGDHEIGLGGCMLETGSGLIDARLSTQLSEIAAEFLDIELGVEQSSSMDPMVAAAIKALGNVSVLSSGEPALQQPSYEGPRRDDKVTRAAELRAREIINAAEAEAKALLERAEADAVAMRATISVTEPAPSQEIIPSPRPARAMHPAMAKPGDTVRPAIESVENPLEDEVIDELIEGVGMRVPADQLLPKVPPAPQKPSGGLDEATDSLARMLGKKKPKPVRPW
ncbi:MAG: FliH/SctL family protein [Candidatus Sericytochromatia bacterium]|nr:FliH/SctL family protein [Candidatus Sericytochromatia bacterium]